jgi:hypothetical protein
MTDQKRSQEDDIDQEIPQAKREKPNQEAESSLGDLFKVQLIEYPTTPPTVNPASHVDEELDIDLRALESLSIQGNK